MLIIGKPRLLSVVLFFLQHFYKFKIISKLKGKDSFLKNMTLDHRQVIFLYGLFGSTCYVENKMGAGWKYRVLNSL